MHRFERGDRKRGDVGLEGRHIGKHALEGGSVWMRQFQSQIYYLRVRRLSILSLVLEESPSQKDCEGTETTLEP